MREPAPPYVGEGPHALWHVSENAAIERFEPHVSATAASGEPRVWAVDTRHLPLYWFPRECPRGTFWATSRTTPEDAELLGARPACTSSRRAGCERMRGARVVAYRLPEATFAPDGEVGGYWLSRAAVEPLDVVELGDLVARHEASGIELRSVPDLWPIWNRVVASTLEFSGIRLHNALPRSRLGERALLRDSGSARESGRRRAELAQDDEAVQILLEPTVELRRDGCHRVAIGRRAEPQDRDTARRHQREAELGGDGRLGERLRESDAVRVRRLLLRSSPDHRDVVEARS